MTRYLKPYLTVPALEPLGGEYEGVIASVTDEAIRHRDKGQRSNEPRVPDLEGGSVGTRASRPRVGGDGRMKNLTTSLGLRVVKWAVPVVRTGMQFDLFNDRPIELSGFRLVARAIEVVGDPSLTEWARAFEFVHATGESAAFWIGDLWNYGEGRSEWREQLPQALADIGLDYKIETFWNVGSVARRVKTRARAVAPSFGHANAVANLEEEEQIEILTEAKTQNLTVQETRDLKRQKKRRRVVEGQARLAGIYRVVYADPPWLYNDRGVITTGDAYGRAERHYRGMTIDQLCKLPVAAHVAEDAVLFLWVTSPMLAECWPVIEAWGFTYKTGLVWDKVLHNFGHYVSVRHEHLLICTRGSCLPDAPTPMPDSVQTIRRGDVHSEKPDEFRQIITKLYTTGPYLELFGRKKVENWDVYGNDAALWHVDAVKTA